MTLIVVFNSPSRVLLAADGQATFISSDHRSPPTTIRYRKLRPVAGHDWVFGLIGPSEPHDELEEWLSGLNPRSWRQLWPLLADEISRRNGEGRARVRTAGLDPEQQRWNQIVVAGFIGKDNGIAVANDQGTGGSSSETDTDFVGLFDGVARAALVTARIAAPGYQPDSAAKLHAIMDGFCDVLPELRRPVEVWEITPGNPPTQRFPES